MEKIYAIIDGSNVCTGVSFLAGAVTNPNLIDVTDEATLPKIGDTYSNGTWVPCEVPEFAITTHEVIAKSAELEGGDLVLEVAEPVGTGTLVKFDAPCACYDVTGGLVIGDATYEMCNAMGFCVTGQGGVWDQGAMVAVILDEEDGKAFIQNGMVTADQISAASISSGSYRGTGTANMTLNFSFTPKLVVVTKNNQIDYPNHYSQGVFVRGEYVGITRLYSTREETGAPGYVVTEVDGSYVDLTWGDKSISWRDHSTYGNHGAALNENAMTYNWVAFG